MKVTTPNHNIPGPPQPPKPPTPSDPTSLLKEKEILAYETQNDQVTLFETDGSKVGNNKVQGEKLFNKLFLPSNYPESVSSDYASVRRWSFARDVAGSVTSYLGMSAALNAVNVGNGPLTVGLAWMMRDSISGIGKFAGGMMGKAADSDPKGWTMKGEYIENAGYLLEATLAVCPGAFLAIAPTAQVIKAVGSTAKGAAQAPIEQHMAKGNNLAEVRAKNGNQDLVSSAIGGALAFGIDKVGQHYLGTASTPILMAAATAARIFTAYQYTHALNLDPINQKVVSVGVRRWLQAPDSSKFSEKIDGLHLGCAVEKLVAKPDRFRELTSLYAGKNYLLDVQGKDIQVLLREGSTEADQLAATFQAALVQRLRAGSSYQILLAKDGQESADHWAVETTLRAMPKNPKPIISNDDDPIRLNPSPARSQWLDGTPTVLEPMTREDFSKLL